MPDRTPEQQRRLADAMRHVTPAYGPELPFERIAINQGALCIECKACGRRTALTSKDCPHIYIGNIVFAAKQPTRGEPASLRRRRCFVRDSARGL